MSDFPTLKLDNVSRALSGRSVVRALDLTLDRGNVLGLLGVNGAGKSTTLRMIAGVLAPSAGQVLIDNQDLTECPTLARTRIGYLPEQVPLYHELRVDEYLHLCARLHGLRGAAARRAADVATAHCDLGDVRRRLLGNLSRGFQQRVGLAQAILHSPALIVLDEPTSGLDPLQAANIRALIRDLGRTHAVIVSTHLLPDVLACCGQVAILHQGRLRFSGPLQQLSTAELMCVRVAAVLDEEKWNMHTIVQSAQRGSDHEWRVVLVPGATPQQLAEAIVKLGWGLQELRADGASLEQIFLRIAADESPLDVQEAA